jgi:ankyrin repeat protein
VADNPTRVQPLHSAASVGAREIMALLLEAGAAVDARQQHGWTPLHARALHGDVPGSELLLAHGADPTPRADNGKSAADLAAEKGHAELATILRNRSPASAV